jgi:Putative DNA-binding domain
MHGYPSKELTETLSEEHLLLRLRSAEHDFVERKSKTDQGGWLRTAVAFANSAPIGWPAVLYVGVDDAGNPQFMATPDGRSLEAGLESVAKSVNDMIERAYPAIYRYAVPLRLGTGACLAVVVPGSAERPHFAGKSYVRRGPETVEATEGQFDSLVADRIDIVREIRKLLGQTVIVNQYTKNHTGVRSFLIGQVVACTAFTVTVQNGQTQKLQSFSLRRLDLSYSHSQEMAIFETFEP